jgi:hypothetical protein
MARATLRTPYQFIHGVHCTCRGDANSYLRSLLPDYPILYHFLNRALCVLDPYGLRLDWDIIELAGKSRAVECSSISRSWT